MTDPYQQSGLERSLWVATAKNARARERLTGSLSADVFVVGAGFTGLACALSLAERGVRVVVLEARDVGNGGSGRNGGQVIPGLKQDPDELLQIYGPGVGERVVELAGGAAQRTFELIERHRIDCDARPGGWIQPAHSATALRTIEARVNAWRKRGAAVELLDRAAAASALGTAYYHGAWIDRRAGAVQPLSYVRGLALAAESAGASVFVDSAVTALQKREGRWVAATAEGEVSADTAVLATDAYSGPLLPQLQHNFVGLNSVQIASDVLPDALRAAIIPCALPVSETRKLIYYYRLNDEGRFVMGGRGNVDGDVPEHVFAALRMVATRLYPQLAGIGWPFRWWGQVGLTTDWLPHLAEPAPGLWSGSGYCGRGVAMATTMGRVLANRVLGGELARSDPALDFPVTRLAGVPFWSFRKPGVATAIGWFRLRETLGMPA